MRNSICLTLFFCLLALISGISRANYPSGWTASDWPAWSSPVNPEAIVVEGGTDIKWMPEPFEYKTGSSVRYIDFVDGSDANDGKTQTSAWKHHPWDANATGEAAKTKGIHTYVFKGGVVYRGQLIGKESGSTDEPIRLTYDPEWGSGAAILAGSEAVYSSWRRLSADETNQAGLPKSATGNVWATKIGSDFEPWALWLVDKNGKRTRQTLARWPNWRVEHPYNHFTQWFRVKKVEEGNPRTTIYSDVLKGYDKDAFKGATIWVDHPNASNEFTIMGPVSSSVGRYDPEQGSLQPELNHPRRHPDVNSPFYLENKAWFLDEAGEWYFDRDKGMLYFWPSQGDPNGTTVEVAHRLITIDLQDARYINIAGLTFTGGNSIDPKDAVDVGGYKAPENFALQPAIRLLGDCRSITINNIRVDESAGGAIANMVTQREDIVSDIWITDSEFTHLDNDGICLHRGFTWRITADQPKARLTNVHILRNRLYDIGKRGLSHSTAGKGIDLNGPEVADVAGNVIEHIAAHGININGGRPTAGWMGTDAAETPLVRIQVRQNKVKDALLYKTDFGNIEFWQTGPAYIYNNISINPIGFIPHRNTYHKNEAFYFDHGIKGYLFNNIGWSDERDDAYQGIIGTSFYKDVRTHWNAAFQNTSMNFRTHYAHEGSAGDQQFIIGNLMLSTVDIDGFLSYWRLQEASEIAISRNLFAGDYASLYNRWRGDTFYTLEEMHEALSDSGNLLAKDVGWVTDDVPVIDPAKHDFRPTADSAAIDRGAKLFLPWSLYGVVGEWYFRLQPRNPNEILSYDLYPQEFYSSFEMIRLGGEMPDNRLVGSGFGVNDFIPGVLEDWTETSALRFDGEKTLHLPHSRLVQDFSFKSRQGEVEVNGKERRTVNITDSNFLIEAVFLRQGSQGGQIAGKWDGSAGYVLGLNDEGELALSMSDGQQKAIYNSTGSLPENTWHHTIAEVDRSSGTVKMYINGKEVTVEKQGTMPAKGSSLENAADFVVGQGFIGALDFLRVSRGTLADAETNINELMSFQFNGPHLHDFTGRSPTGERRDIGALEHPSVSGRKPINYTPPQPKQKVVEKSSDEFLQGDDRLVKQTDWGTISAPKTAKPGNSAYVQVAFPTESIPKTMVMKMDLHGIVDGKRKTGLGRAAPLTVEPGVTTPYSRDIAIPATSGLTRAIVVIYVSPSGNYSDKLYGTEIAFAVENAPKAKTTGSSEPRKNDGAAMNMPPADLQESDLGWATVFLPKTASAGDKATLYIKLKDGIVNSTTKLCVDTHWFEGKERRTSGPRGRPETITSGDQAFHQFTLPIPNKPGLSAVQYIIYLSPDGSWQNKTNSGSVGFKVN